MYTYDILGVCFAGESNSFRLLGVDGRRGRRGEIRIGGRGRNWSKIGSERGIRRKWSEIESEKGIGRNWSKIGSERGIGRNWSKIEREGGTRYRK